VVQLEVPSPLSLPTRKESLKFSSWKQVKIKKIRIFAWMGSDGSLSRTNP
jgi:hypothetical protein